MKKRFIRHGFNMVEVALALAIIAIGISSILVLFPVGANANKAAIANNNLADIAEYMMSYIRAGVTSEWRNITSSNENNSAAYFFTNSIGDQPDSKGDEGVVLETIMIDPNKVIEDNPNLYRLDSNSNQSFLFAQVSGDSIDFAAVVKIWKEEIEMDVPYIKNGKAFEYVKLPSGTDIDKFARVLCVEISWPAQAPLKNRERRVFRQEFFNENFKRNVTTP